MGAMNAKGLAGQEYANRFERDANVRLVHVGLCDSVIWVGLKKTRKTEWHHFFASRTVSSLVPEEMLQEILDARVEAIKKSFPRCVIIESRVGDNFWSVQFKVSAKSLSNLSS